ncbi:MAG TPA: tyrosine-protein phosphatase [Thermomicrobiales bacterium]|nr:tyrosine-protein phosphatase [Thermomicrobiales bacterium]
MSSSPEGLADRPATGDGRDRALFLAGCGNVRHLGGLPVAGGGLTRPGVYWRADSLAHLVPAARARLLGAGIRTIVDLRSPGELAGAPSVWRDHPAVAYHALPLLGDADLARLLPHTDALRDGYAPLLAPAAGAVARIVAALAAPGATPAAMHCLAGRDRAGFVAALLLAAVGVEAAAIVADYAASPGASAAVMATTLDHLEREWGGAVAYLRAAGVTAATLAALRARLVGAGDEATGGGG